MCMDRTELAQYYMRVMKDDEKASKLLALKERKKELKQTIKTIENYKEMMESQLESVLDRIDYLQMYG